MLPPSSILNLNPAETAILRHMRGGVFRPAAYLFPAENRLSMTTLPLKAVERILRNAGAKRVSRGAAEEFSKFLEEFAGEVARDANQLAQHSGRVTVTEQDVLMVRKIRRTGR